MMENESDEDNWQPSPTNNQRSMFQKIVVDFTHEDIDRNVQQQLSEPHYFNDEDIDPEDRPQDPQKYQSLYNPLEDDENENWVQKVHINPEKKPLICPNCFSQLAYSYKCVGENKFMCSKPTNIQVLQTKVIRNRTCPQKMDLSAGADPQKMLLQRQEQINVKIVCTCQCGVDVGYYDVNKSAYVLINVV